MRKVVIFVNGNLSDVSQAKKIINKEDCLIAVDGGVKHILKLGLTPHIIIGDLDSISISLRKKLEKFKIEWIRFHRKIGDKISIIPVSGKLKEITTYGLEYKLNYETFSKGVALIEHN